MDKNMPNTFITDSGTLLFLFEDKIPKDTLDRLNAAQALCESMEKRYSTKDVIEMLKGGANGPELAQYINSKQFLLSWGYD